MLHNEFLAAKFCFDTAENELSEVKILTISAIFDKLIYIDDEYS